MVYVGIDPGKSGAVARLSPQYLGAGVPIEDTPMLKGKGGSAYDEVEMARLLRRLCAVNADQGGRVLVVIEKVHAMPTQGVTSMFTFGMGYGIWLGILAALEIPHVRVAPVTWKKRVLLDVDKDDDAAVAAAAARLYPVASGSLRTPRGRVLDGRVDALLLAHYGLVAGL